MVVGSDKLRSFMVNVGKISPTRNQFDKTRSKNSNVAGTTLAGHDSGTCNNSHNLLSISLTEHDVAVITRLHHQHEHAATAFEIHNLAERLSIRQYFAFSICLFLVIEMVGISVSNKNVTNSATANTLFGISSNSNINIDNIIDDRVVFNDKRGPLQRLVLKFTTKNRFSRALNALLFLVAVTFLGAVPVYFIEGNWTMAQAIYFVTFTLTKVVYGDFAPTIIKSCRIEWTIRQDARQQQIMKVKRK
jgi:hypothetical protein